MTTDQPNTTPEQLRQRAEIAEQVARLRGRALPQWWADAKLGIFVHWTAATVPAFAPLGPDPFALAAEHGWPHAMANTPYVEWYENSLAIPGSPTEAHHMHTYGADVAYSSFVATFRETANRADLTAWAELFRRAGAGYSVLVTKHHDGVTLWPSSTGPSSDRRLVIRSIPSRR
jgi:alpha-L-fucosidase